MINCAMLRDVFSTNLLSTPVELGGPGVIVQIDESLFNHKSKCNRGRRASKEQSAFGLADTSSKPAITYMETVDKRDATTLLPIMYENVCKCIVTCGTPSVSPHSFI
jgi:hypothetical protein